MKKLIWEVHIMYPTPILWNRYGRPNWTQNGHKIMWLHQHWGFGNFNTGQFASKKNSKELGPGMNTSNNRDKYAERGFKCQNDAYI